MEIVKLSYVTIFMFCVAVVIIIFASCDFISV